MEIREINDNKKQFISLLLLADEQENMIDRYLEKGTMYVLDDDGVKAECVVTDEENGCLEIKNIATVPDYQGKGYAKALIEFIVNLFKFNDWSKAYRNISFEREAYDFEKEKDYLVFRKRFAWFNYLRK